MNLQPIVLTETTTLAQLEENLRQLGKGNLFVSFCNAKITLGIEFLREQIVVDYEYDEFEHLVYVWLAIKEANGNKTITCFNRNMWEMQDSNGFYLTGTKQEAESWLYA